jgi:hypothetical protein
MTEADGAWMARIISRFGHDEIAAAVSVGRYDVASARYLIDTLESRRDRVLRRYFQKLSPIADLHVRGDALCGVDLARASHIDPPGGFSARVLIGAAAHPLVAAYNPRSRGQVCVDLGPHRAREADRTADPIYLTVELNNGGAETPLRAHLYDLGRSTPLRLVGIERE